MLNQFFVRISWRGRRRKAMSRRSYIEKGGGQRVETGEMGIENGGKGGGATLFAPDLHEGDGENDSKDCGNKSGGNDGQDESLGSISADSEGFGGRRRGRNDEWGGRGRP